MELEDGLKARERALILPTDSMVWSDVMLYASLGRPRMFAEIPDARVAGTALGYFTDKKEFPGGGSWRPPKHRH